MKHKLLSALLCIGLLTIYLACDKDDGPLKDGPNSLQQELPNIRSVSLEDAGDIFNRLKTRYKLDKHMLMQHATGKSTVDTLGVTIYTDNIKEATLGDYTSYTMFMEFPEQDSSKFYNLTIEDKNGTEGMFVTRYEPTSAWVQDKSTAFEGGINTFRVNNDITIIDQDAGGSGATNNTEYPSDCDGWIEVTTTYIPVRCSCVPSGLGHLPDECVGPCNSPGYWLPQYTYECFSFDVGGSDSGNQGNSDSGNNSNGTTNPPDDDDNNDTSIGVMIDQTCPPGKIRDAEGACVCPVGKTEDSNGNCICPNGYTENWRRQCVREGKCEELEKLMQSYPNTTNPYINGDNKSIRIALTNIDDYLDQNKEYGYALYNLGEFPTYGPYAHFVPPQSNRKLRFKPRAYMFGTIHTHPTGITVDGETTIPMFSLEDVYTLLSMRNRYLTGPAYLNQNNPNGDDLFVSLLVVRQGGQTRTYAIKIGDINQLQSLGSISVGGTKWKRRVKKFKEKYEDDANNAEGSATQYQKAFLELVSENNLGISLFEMGQENTGTPGVSENWTELILNDQGEVISTPCNL